MRVSGVLCVIAVTMRGLVQEWLDAEGLDVRPGEGWGKQLLRGMRLSYKKPAKYLKELHSPEQQHANTHRLFIKLRWLMSTCGVSADRVVNVDETSCRLLPVHQIGWGRRGVKRAQLHGNTREATTFTVAFSMDRARLDMLVQIVHGQDRRRLAGAALAGAHSPLHIRERLGTTTTMMQLTAALDDVMNLGKEGQAWILLWDMASIHSSEATRAAMQATFPHIVLYFIPPRSSSYLQPCDVAVFRSFKSCIQAQGEPQSCPLRPRSTTWSRTRHGHDSLRPNGQVAQSRTSATKTRRGRLCGVARAPTATTISARPSKRPRHARDEPFAKHITPEPAEEGPPV